MIYIKAVNFLSSVEFVRIRFGPEGLRRVLEKLSSADQEYFDGSASLPTKWVRMDVWIRFHKMMLSELCGGDENVQIAAGEHNAAAALKGIHRVFMKLGSPGFIIRMAKPLFLSYFKKDEGKLGIRMQKLENNRFECTMTGFDPDHRLLEVGMIGWLRKALELSGAKSTQVDLVCTAADGKGYTLYNISWEV